MSGGSTVRVAAAVCLAAVLCALLGVIAPSVVAGDEPAGEGTADATAGETVDTAVARPTERAAGPSSTGPVDRSGPVARPGIGARGGSGPDVRGGTRLDDRQSAPSTTDSIRTPRGQATPTRGNESTTPTTTVPAGLPTTATETVTGPAPRSASLRRSPDSPTIEVRYTLDRTPGRPGSVRVVYEFDPPETLVNFTFYPGDRQTVLDAEGFESRDGAYHWDGDPATARLVYRVDVNHTSAFGGLDAVDVGTWAFLGDSGVAEDGYYYYYRGAAPTYRRQFAVERSGVVTDSYAYLGPYTTHEAGGRRNYTLVVPASASPAADPDRVLDRLVAVDRRFDVGATGDVVGFVPGDPIRRFGGRGTTDEFWVSSDVPLGGGVYYHELVHTKQLFVDRAAFRDGDAYWFVEASAEYYESFLPYRLGEFDARQFWALVRARENRSAVLTAVGPEDDTGADYEKGAHVLAALDLRIRNVTDGRATLADVLRVVNRRTRAGETVDFAAFKDVVADVAGRSLDDWLERYANSSALPSLPETAPAHDVTGGVPVAATGPNRTAREGSTVALNARDSRDPNVEALSYDWRQLDGAEATVVDPDAPRTAVRLPRVERNRTLTFAVTVADDDGNADTDTVTVEVRNATGAKRGVDVDGSGRRSTDRDGDGVHEDVDGDGDFDTGDVQALLDDLVTDARTVDRPDLFDVDGDGAVGTGDVQALLDELVGTAGRASTRGN